MQRASRIMHPMTDVRYMELAMEQAAQAAEWGEVPIGAVVVAQRPVITEYSRIPLREQQALLEAYGNLARSQGLADDDALPDELVVSVAGNRRERDADPAGHAEFLALREASRVLGTWRLSICTVYVTLEPCIMCAGLMHQARVKRCVFGAFDPKAGALGSLYSIHGDTRLNHVFSVEGGVLGEECGKMMKDFFSERRRRNKELKRQAADAAFGN